MTTSGARGSDSSTRIRRRSTRRALAIVCRSFVSAIVVGAAVATSAPAAAQQPVTDRDVEIAYAGSQGDAMRDLVRERLGDLGLHAYFREEAGFDLNLIAPPPEKAATRPWLAHVYLDFTRVDQATLLVVDGPWERGLLRYASRSDGDELARENLAHILEGALAALMAGYRIGVERPAPRHPPPAKIVVAPAKPSPRQPSPTVRLEGALGAMVGTGPFNLTTEGMTLAIAVRRTSARSELSPALRLDGEIHLPVTRAADPIELRMSVLSIRALAVLDVRLGGGIAVGGFAGAGTDLIRTEPLAANASYAIAPADTRATFTVRAGLAIAWSSALTLRMRVFVDGDAVRPTYAYEVGGVPMTLAQPPSLRPGISIELGLP